MNGSRFRWRRGFTLLLLAVGSRWAIAQDEPALNLYTEELLHQEETAGIPALRMEELAEYRRQPINLNRATREQLAESRLFTAFQIEVLLSYRIRFGPLFSVYELAGLSGFRRSRVFDIAPYLAVGPGTAPSAADPRSLMILFTAERTFPTARGFFSRDSLREVPAYTGTPLKTGIRLKATLSSTLSAALGYDKDPGENFLHHGVPEFLSGCIQYRGTRYIQKLVVGNFRVQHGLGLVNGSEFMSTVESYFPTTPVLSKIIPYASLAECNFERGAGCQISIGRIGMMAWTSYRHMDLTLHQTSEIPAHMDWEEAARETGLHRTSGELAGRSLAYCYHQGLTASFRSDHLTLGIMWGWKLNGLTSAGQDSLQCGGKPFRTALGSTHGAWYNHRIGLSWELAVTGNRSLALLAGITYRMNDFLQGLILIHRYGTNYRGMVSSAYSAGSQVQNDMGVAAGWHLEAGKFLIADLNLELFRYPAPKYLTDVPSGSGKAVCSIKNTGIKELQWRFRIYRKWWQTTTDKEGPGIRPLTDWKIIRSEIQFEYTPGKSLSGQEEPTRKMDKIAISARIRQKHPATLQWQSRVIFSWHQGSTFRYPDYAVVQRISLTSPPKLRGVLQVAIFQVNTWENRIYLYEPGLLYSFDFPVCYGTGEKVTGILSAGIGKKLTLSVKFTGTIYHDRDAVGTGLDMREGNKKWELGLQFRVNL